VQPGDNRTGARNLIRIAINFIRDPAFNSFAKAGASRFLFVESKLSIPIGHSRAKDGITASGFVEGTDFDHHDATTLNDAMNALGTTYAAIVVASDFGGTLRRAELDILNARAAEIIAFLNNGGGLFAMAESNGGAHLTEGRPRFAFLPVVVSSSPR